MKNTLLCFFSLFITLNLFSQTNHLKKVMANRNSYSIPISSIEKTLVKNNVYDKNGLRVEIETGQFGQNIYHSNQLHWKRTLSGSAISGSTPLPTTTSFDFVIGDNGNKILVAFFRLGIEYRVYEFLSGAYSLVDTGVVTPVVYNPPTSVMQYSGVALDIDQNDNVVVMYKSFSTGPYDSDIINFFAKSGDIDGNWQSYNNSYDAFLITTGLGLPSDFITSQGDVCITKYAQNNLVSFAFPVEKLNGNSFLYLVQVSFNDLHSNNVAGLSHHTIASSSTETYIYPSLDAPSKAFESSINDDWVLAYDVIHGKNDIKVVKGKNGSFFSTTYLSTLLNLDKQLGLPNIRYMSSGFGLAFSSNDTNSCSDGWDPFFMQLTDSIGKGEIPMVRLNTDSNLIGDQRSLYFTMPHNLNKEPFISYFNPSTSQVVSASLSSQVPCSSGISLPELSENGTTKTLIKKELYSLQGQLLYVLKPDDQIPSITREVLIIARYYDDGSVSTEKLSIIR